MTSQASLVQPPRIAVWLVNLFSVEEVDSILGDLLEEFSHLASKWGVAFARSWYWRQAVKTIVHPFGTAFRVAPWSTTAAVAGGFLLQRFVSHLPEPAIFAVLGRYQVFERHFNVYVFLATNGIALAHVFASMLVGCVLGFAVKGREMVATMTLALVLWLLIGAAWLWIAMQRSIDVAWILWSCADPLAIVVGGAIVRTRRSAAKALPSAA